MQKGQEVRDPVCGMVKPRNEMKFALNYKGKEYYFCSERCRDMFLPYPDYWTNKKD